MMASASAKKNLHETESDSSEYETDREEKNIRPKSTLLKKQKVCRYEQKFSDIWLSNSLFKTWIEKKLVKGKYVPFCKICKTSLSCAKTALIRHGKSKSHGDHVKMTEELNKSQPSASLLLSGFDETVKMEIKLCSFIAEKNLPISICEDLVPLLRSLFPSDKALKRVTLGKQKATNTVRQVLGFHYMKENVSLLRDNKFSIVLDETTDRSTKSQMAVLGTFFDMENFKMRCVFIDLIEMPNGKADTIYEKLKHSLKEKDIPIENVIGFCSDTCNVMFGKHHSVSQLLVRDHPWILPVKCSCHLIHICASYASQKLPKFLEDLCRNISAHFHFSSQRRDALHEFQEFFNVEHHIILKPGQTRWLSMKMCVDRILEQYEPLTQYFTQLVFDDPTYTNDHILKALKNPFTKAYLEFLSYNLGRLTSFNKLFQSDMPLLHELRSEISSLITSLCSDFMNIDYVKKQRVESINIKDEKHYVPLSMVYLGMSATDTIQGISKELGNNSRDIELFYRQCRDFLIECVHQIRSRFDDLEKFDFLTYLCPEVALNLKQPSLSLVFNKLPYLKNNSGIDCEAADREWRQQAMIEGRDTSMEFRQFWELVFKAKTSTGAHKFSNLSKVLCILLSFPFSNASVERIFSQLKLIKTEHRTALKHESLVGLLTTKLALNQKGIHQAATLDPPKDMIRLHSRMQSNASDSEAAALRNEFLNRLSHSHQQ